VRGHKGIPGWGWAGMDIDPREVVGKSAGCDFGCRISAAFGNILGRYVDIRGQLLHDLDHGA